MKTFFFILLIFFLSTLSFAQTLPKKSLTVEYFGEGISHPGLSLGINHYIIPYKDKQINFAKVRHLFQTGLSLAFYSHRKSHFAIIFFPHFNYHFLFKNGITLRVNTGLGYLRQFNSGTTYEVSENGEVDIIRFAGRNKFTTHFSLGFGKNLMKNKNIPLAWNMNFGIFTESPTNTGFLPHLFIKIGVDYFFNFKK